VTEPLLQLIATVEDGFARNRMHRRITVIRTVVDVVRETAPTGWTFFHLVGSIQERDHLMRRHNRESETRANDFNDSMPLKQENDK
jgi:hypothetical protein